MEILIVGFASTEVFGRDLIDYFTQETGTSISRIEKFKYEFRYPKNVPSKTSPPETDFIINSLLSMIYFFRRFCRTILTSYVSSNVN